MSIPTKPSIFTILALVFFPVLGITQIKQDAAREIHAGIINDPVFNDDDRILLRLFVDVLKNYNEEKFIALFSPEYVNYYKTSIDYPTLTLAQAMMFNLSVPASDWPTYFAPPVKRSLEKDDFTTIIDVFFVGREDFGGNGHRIFYKCILKNGTEVAGRVFLFPSGPQGKMELHGSYG
jgi:hypothetical protein